MAIAARFAKGESESPEAMYEQFDKTIRFHAKRTGDRRAEPKQVSQKEEQTIAVSHGRYTEVHYRL